MRLIIDTLLTRDATQRLRLSQTLLASVVMVVGVVVMQFYVWSGKFCVNHHFRKANSIS